LSKAVNTIVSAITSIVYMFLLADSNSVSGQNMTNQTATSTNTTIMTSSDSSSSAKLHLEEAIKALEKGDKPEASSRLTAAQQAMSGASAQAKERYEEGMKALMAGDSSGALMHLKAARDALG
jgi:hypothetical protein